MRNKVPYIFKNITGQDTEFFKQQDVGNLYYAMHNSKQEEVIKLVKRYQGILYAPIAYEWTNKDYSKGLWTGTILHEAVYEVNLPMVQRLIELGANHEALDSKGLTPYDVACGRKKYKIQKWLENHNYVHTAAEVKAAAAASYKDTSCIQRLSE